jgi:hypothetical protein
MGEWLAQTSFNGACEVCNQNFLKFAKHCSFTCSKVLHAWEAYYSVATFVMRSNVDIYNHHYQHT